MIPRFYSWDIPKGNENILPQKNVYVDVYRNNIVIGQMIEIIQMRIS